MIGKIKPNKRIKNYKCISVSKENYRVSGKFAIEKPTLARRVSKDLFKEVIFTFLKDK